jgi:hypothetical protein
MRRLSLIALIVALAVASLAPAQEVPEPLRPGKNIPGPFHPYNLNGEFKGKYHCLVSQHDLDPVVLLIARGLDDNEAFANLVKALDGAVARNPAVRLRCVVVFLDPDLKGGGEDDPTEELAKRLEQEDRRDETIKRLEKFTAGLKHVVVGLAAKSDLAKYQVPDNAALTAVLYHKLKVVASLAAPRGKVDDARAKEILGLVASKLGATR